MTLRMTLALLLIAPAAMTYPWQQVPHRWILGIAVVVVAVLFARWRGEFHTTLIARRWAVWRRNHGKGEQAGAERVAVALRLAPGSADTVALAPLAGYLDRYGIRCASVRVITRHNAEDTDTWISLILDASANLPALQARSADLPLAATAQVVARRLAEHLTEHGLRASLDPEPATPLGTDVQEKWTAVHTGDGVISAYALDIDADLQDRVSAARGAECWSVIEFTGTPAHPVVSAACAVRGDGPVDGAHPQPGRQRPLLDAMNPVAVGTLDLPAGPVPADWTWSVRSGAALTQSNMN